MDDRIEFHSGVVVSDDMIGVQGNKKRRRGMRREISHHLLGSDVRLLVHLDAPQFLVFENVEKMNFISKICTENFITKIFN